MRQSDFEKELELEVVEPDEADKLIQEALKDKRPSRLRDIIPKREAAGFGSDNAGVINKVDTLREEEECPFGMGSDDCGLSEGSCKVCGYDAPVEGLGDPDIDKAKKFDQLQEKAKQREQRHDVPPQTKMNRPGRPSFSGVVEDYYKKRNKQDAPREDLLNDQDLTEEEWQMLREMGGLPKDQVRKPWDRYQRGNEKMTKKYPWPKCIQDQLDAGHSQESAEKICGSIRAKNSSVQQVHFLYELIGNGFDDHAEKYIQDEIDAGRADQDLMQAYGVLQTQGVDAFRDFVFKNDPLGTDMVESLYADDSPEDNTTDEERQHRYDRYERNLKAADPELSKGKKRNPAERGNWNYLTGR